MNRNTAICNAAKRLDPGQVNLSLVPVAVPVKGIKNKAYPLAAEQVHELRNPLSIIFLAMEIMGDTALDEIQRQYLEMIMRGSMRLNYLITGILNFSDAPEIYCEEYSVRQLLEDVVSENGDKILLKKIKVIKQYDPVDIMVSVNIQHVKMAATNIIINAIDAMSSIEGVLRLMTKSIDGKCVLEIADNGIGISKRRLKKIFKPYFTGKPDGLGLGLATTLNNLLLNHVKTEVHSVMGKGTTFTLSFDKL
jgi:signal transduction histidine kinase